MASLNINSFAIESDLNSLIVEYQRTHEQTAFCCKYCFRFVVDVGTPPQTRVPFNAFTYPHLLLLLCSYTYLPIGLCSWCSIHLLISIDLIIWACECRRASFEQSPPLP